MRAPSVSQPYHNCIVDRSYQCIQNCVVMLSSLLTTCLAINLTSLPHWSARQLRCCSTSDVIHAIKMCVSLLVTTQMNGVANS